MISRANLLQASAGAAAASLLGADPSGSPKIAFSGARLIDGNGGAPIDESVVLVEGKHVIAVGGARDIRIPSDARTVDVHGKTLIPALLDAHAHVGLTKGTKNAPENYTAANIERQLQRFERYGVLAVQIMGTDTELAYGLRMQQEAGQMGGAVLFTAGTGFGRIDGWPPESLGAPWIRRPPDPQTARANVRSLAIHRPDLVKVWVDSNFGTKPELSRETVSAIIDEAHRNGLRVAAHLFYLDDAKFLVEQGLDVVAHSVRDREIDDELLAMMKDRDVVYVPTLALDESLFIYADGAPYENEPFFQAALDPGLLAHLRSDEYRKKTLADPATAKWRTAAEMSKHNLPRVHRAGVRVAMGTDSGATVERVQGFDSHRELELMVEAGLSPLEAITAASVNPPYVMGARAEDLGAIAPGKRANLVVLDADPTLGIRNTRTISQVWHDCTLVPSWRG